MSYEVYPRTADQHSGISIKEHASIEIIKILIETKACGNNIQEHYKKYTILAREMADNLI